MWIRKSEHGIQMVLEARDRRCKDLGRPLAWATALTLTIGVLYFIGFRAWSQNVIIISSAPPPLSAATLITGLLLFVCVFSVSVYQQRRGALFGDSVFLCRECKEPNSANEKMRCACGGSLEPLEYFDWVSESETAGAADH